MVQVGGSRAQSQVIGAVLIFAFIIAALGAAQVVLVPQNNEEVEFNHNQNVQQDMQELRGAIQRSAAVGASQSESVDLAADYPTRFLLLNPGEGAGTIRTAGGSSLVIQNAGATDKETADFWNGSNVTAPSQRLIYSPNYNYYDSAPETVYENSVLYNSFPDGTNIAKSDQDIVNGRQIYLTALAGNKSTSQTGSASVDVKPVSSATEKITVERNQSGENLNITVPTQLSEEVWVQELLAEEIDDTNDGPLEGPESDESCKNFASQAGNSRFVSGCDYSNGNITIMFERTNSNGNPVTYSLKMAKVGVGTGISTPDAQYITDQKGDGADVSLNGRQEIVFQVRDKYNNPAEDAEVDVNITDGPGRLFNEGEDITGQADENISVGPDGKVELAYVAPGTTGTSPFDVTVSAKFDSGSFDSGGPKDANVSMQVINASRIDRTQPLINPSDTLTLEKAEIGSGSCPGQPGGQNSCRVKITFSSPNQTEIKEFRYVFYSTDSQGFSGASGQAFVNLSDPSPDQTFELAGDFQEISGGPITVSGSRTISVEFYQDSGDPHAVKSSEFFVISLIVDGEREVYFISPESP